MEIEHRVALADGRVLACLESGDPTGLPVVYLHGYPGSRLESRVLARAASRLRIRLLAPDRPGFGESTFQPGRGIASTGADVARLVDKVGLERFAVVGMSGGGPHALSCAAYLPERVTRVALVGGVAPASPTLIADMIPPYRLALAAGSRAPALARLGLSLIAGVLRRHPAFFISRIEARSGTADQRVLTDPQYRQLLIESTLEALRQGGRSIAHELTLLARPWDIALATIKTPVSIWQGLADHIVPPAMGRYLADSLPRGTLHCLRNEGHLSLLVRHAERVLADLTRDHWRKQA